VEAFSKQQAERENFDYDLLDLSKIFHLVVADERSMPSGWEQWLESIDLMKYWKEFVIVDCRVSPATAVSCAIHTRENDCYWQNSSKIHRIPHSDSNHFLSLFPSYTCDSLNSAPRKPLIYSLVEFIEFSSLFLLLSPFLFFWSFAFFCHLVKRR